jgi:hypothetical protein
MPSSYTSSLRFELQFTGENLNLWGDKLNAALSRADASIAGWLTKALTADYALTTANGAADEARNAMLKFTGTGAFTVTIPAVSKRYDVWNACTGVLTVTNGSASVAFQPGEKASVITDGGANISKTQSTDFGGITLTSLGAPSANTDAATKKYVDDSVFGIAAGSLPGQVGNGGKVLTTNGTTASWSSSFTGFALATPTITSASISTSTLDAPTVTNGVTFSGASKQNVQALAALNIDFSASEFQTKSISSNSTFTLSGITASKAQVVILELTINSAAVPSWPAAVKWARGFNPSSSLGNGKHLLGFVTTDGGTNITGVLIAAAIA